MTKSNEPDFTAEWVIEIERLQGLDRQRGTIEMIQIVADDIVKLRRKLRAAPHSGGDEG